MLQPFLWEWEVTLITCSYTPCECVRITNRFSAKAKGWRPVGSVVFHPQKAQLLAFHNLMHRSFLAGRALATSRDDFITLTDLHTLPFSETGGCDSTRAFIFSWLPLIAHCTTSTSTIYRGCNSTLEFTCLNIKYDETYLQANIRKRRIATCYSIILI